MGALSTFPAPPFHSIGTAASRATSSISDSMPTASPRSIFLRASPNPRWRKVSGWNNCVSWRTESQSMSARHLTILWVWIPKRICSGWPKFCFGINFIFLTDTKEFCRLPLRAYSLRASPLFRSRHSPRNCRVGVEQQFYPLRRSALRQVLLCELIHRRDERLDADDRFESIAIRLPLVIAREGI